MSDNRTKALMIAGQCWCDPETAGIEVDARLANSFADRVAPLLDEIVSLRLTDEERKAVEFFSRFGGEHAAVHLRGLLERTKGGEQ